MKAYNDKKLKAKTSNFKCGDVVLLKWRQSRKSESLFDPYPFKVVKINGSMITVERNGCVLVRNSSFMKLYIQDECEIGSRIVKDILFGEDKNIKPEPEIIDDDKTIKLEEEEDEEDGNLEGQDSEGEQLEDDE
ncbi:Retrovirus-related Pol poly from transposon [Brachionus plicatilis]|uniref:Retrovirus-related Pol poly from transposon n=1 Tax=Brachionus plicatilis TaxID=10195 RepID=A0A3M7R0K4_BRAPC|nr:Retrovirus-related Pol poly from transposon [Brachionus plicatilis]